MNQADILSLITQHFPDFTWKSVRFIDHGYDHNVVILDEALVFRVPKNDEYAPLLKDEVALMAELGKYISARIPHYAFVAPDYSIVGYPLVPGVELTAEHYASLSPVDRMLFVQQASRFLNELHAVDISVAESFGVQPHDAQKEQDTWNAAFRTTLLPKLDQRDRSVVEHFLAELSEMIDAPAPRILIHYDLTVDHLLWDASAKELNVIDFSDRTIGDPALDFSGFHEYGEECVQRIIDDYSLPADKLYERSLMYAKRTVLFRMTDALRGRNQNFDEQYKKFTAFFEEN